jgi:hypothetical protein
MVLAGHTFTHFPTGPVELLIQGFPGTSTVMEEGGGFRRHLDLTEILAPGFMLEGLLWARCRTNQRGLGRRDQGDSPFDSGCASLASAGRPAHNPAFVLPDRGDPRRCAERRTEPHAG